MGADLDECRGRSSRMRLGRGKVLKEVLDAAELCQKSRYSTSEPEKYSRVNSFLVTRQTFDIVTLHNQSSRSTTRATRATVAPT